VTDPGHHLEQDTPILFGSMSVQSLLFDVAQSGEIVIPPKARRIADRLIDTGMCKKQVDGTGYFLSLDPEYPALQELRAVLQDLAGACVIEGSDATTNVGRAATIPERPLGHKTIGPFHHMVIMVRANEPLDEETVRRRLPSYWAQSVNVNLKTLVNDGVLEEGEGRVFKLSPSVPDSFKTLVLDLPRFGGHSVKPVEGGCGSVQCQPNHASVKSTRANTRSRPYA
jgi:hypothetical protein